MPLKNPFYALLLVSCGALIFTMLIYLIGWMYVPHPERPLPAVALPAWMKWIDRRALFLIAGEVLAIVIFGGATMALDRVFDAPKPAGLSTPPANREAGSDAIA